MSIPTPQERITDTIRGLAQLAHWLDAHPEVVPVGTMTGSTFSVTSIGLRLAAVDDVVLLTALADGAAPGALDEWDAGVIHGVTRRFAGDAQAAYTFTAQQATPSILHKIGVTL